MIRRAAVLMLAGLLLLGLPAYAQEAAPPAEGGEAPEPIAESAKPVEAEPVEAEEEPSEETAEAIRQVPVFEDTNPEYLGDEPPLFEDFVGLAQDFVYRASVGPPSSGRVPVWPRGNFKVGPVLVFPYLDGRVGWSSNVYQDPSEVSAFFLSGGGGISVNYPFRMGNGKIFGGADYKATTYPGEDLKYNEWTLSGGIGYRFDRGYWFRTGVRYQQYVTPTDPENIGLQKRRVLYPFLDLGWDHAFVKHLNLSGGIDLTSTRYLEDEYETGDRDERRAWIKASYPIYRDKTRGYVRYDYRWTEAQSDRINDSSGGELSFGMEGVIPLTESEKLLGSLSLGYRTATWETGTYDDDGSTFDTDGDESNGIVTIRAMLRYLASAKTTVEFLYTRDMDYSTFSNYQVVDRFGLTVTHSLLRDLVLRGAAYVRFSDPNSERSSNTQYGLGAGARYLLIENVDLDFSVDWYRRQAEQEEYDYDSLVAALGLTIYFR